MFLLHPVWMSLQASDPSPPRVIEFPQSGDLLRTIMETAAVGMFLAGPDGRLTYVNAAGAAMLGGGTETCAGRNIAECVVPEDRAAAHEGMRQVLEEGAARHQTELRLVREDGSTFWGLVSLSLLRHEQTGQPFYLVMQITDIDAQKRAEEALAESESRWKFALEGAGQGVWDHDLVHGRAYYSTMWKLMRGFPADAEVDSSKEAWLARVHPDDRDRILEAIRKQDAGELTYNAFEYRERHQDGHWIWILSRGKPVAWNPDGTPARVLGTDTDITSLKEIEATLAGEKEMLRTTLRAIADGVIATDAAGSVEFANPAARAIADLEPDELLAQPVAETIRLVDEAGHPMENPALTCLRDGQRSRVADEAVLITRSGHKRDIRASAALLVPQDGVVTGAVLVLQDVSQSRQLRRELTHAATHDGLTGLFNRVAFEERLEEIRDEVSRRAFEAALCFIDLDRFKALNDGAGHAAGDAMLKRVAEAIGAQMASEDCAGRIGGDEFALLLVGRTPVHAMQAAQRLAVDVSALEHAGPTGRYGIGASIGLTQISPSSPGPAGLMAEADLACYAAKEDGGGKVVTFQSLGSRRDGPPTGP